jgi:hypothetical protein
VATFLIPAPGTRLVLGSRRAAAARSGHEAIAPDCPRSARSHAVGRARWPLRARRARRGALARGVIAGPQHVWSVITQVAADEPALSAAPFTSARSRRSGRVADGAGCTDPASRVAATARWGFGRIWIRPEGDRRVLQRLRACRRAARHRTPDADADPAAAAGRPAPDDLAPRRTSSARGPGDSIGLQRRMHRRFRMERVVTMTPTTRPSSAPVGARHLMIAAASKPFRRELMIPSPTARCALGLRRASPVDLTTAARRRARPAATKARGAGHREVRGQLRLIGPLLDEDQPQWGFDVAPWASSGSPREAYVLEAVR